MGRLIGLFWMNNLATAEAELTGTYLGTNEERALEPRDDDIRQGGSVWNVCWSTEFQSAEDARAV